MFWSEALVFNTTLYPSPEPGATLSPWTSSFNEHLLHTYHFHAWVVITFFSTQKLITYPQIGNLPSEAMLTSVIIWFPIKKWMLPRASAKLCSSLCFPWRSGCVPAASVAQCNPPVSGVFQNLQSVLTWLDDTGKQTPAQATHGNNYIHVILLPFTFLTDENTTGQQLPLLRRHLFFVGNVLVLMGCVVCILRFRDLLKCFIISSF